MDPLNILVKVRSFTHFWDNRGYFLKNWKVPGYANAPFSAKFLRAFVRMYAVNISAKFELRSFTRSWDNSGYCKNLGSPWARPRTQHGYRCNWRSVQPDIVCHHVRSHHSVHRSAVPCRVTCRVRISDTDSISVDSECRQRLGYEGIPLWRAVVAEEYWNWG